MPGHAVVEEYFSGQGVVLVAARGVNGLPTGFRPVGNCPALSFKNAETVEEHKESTTGVRGIDKRLATELKMNIDVTLENFNSKNLADVLRSASTAVAAGSVVSEPIVGYEGLVTALANIKVSAVVVTMTAGSVVLTPYVNDTTDWDYKLNAEAGSIQFNTLLGLTASGPPLGALFPGGVCNCTVGYTRAAQQDIQAFTLASKELYFRFEGLNTAESDSPVVVEAFRYALSPAQELALIGTTLQSFVLSGTLLADVTRTVGSKYYQVRKIDKV